MKISNTCITVAILILFTQSDLFASRSSSYETGRMIGMFFWPIITLLIIRWGISQLRNPKDSNICASALILSAGAYLAAIILGMAYKDSPNDDFKIISSFIIVAITAISFIVAIVGLSKFSSEKYQRGKGAAILALLISCFFLGMFFYGFVQGARNNGYGDPYSNPIGELPDTLNNQSHSNEQLNYSLKNPTGMRSVSAKPVNIDACWAARNLFGSVYHMLIAEELGNYMNTTELADYCSENLTLSLVNPIISRPNSQNTNGLEGLTFHVTAKFNNQDMHWIYWVCIHNGYSYQLSTWGLANQKPSIQRLHQELLDSFKQLDPNKVYQDEEATPNISKVESNYWGYNISDTSMNIRSWDHASDGYAMALDGIYIGPDAGCLIYGLDQSDIKVHKDAFRYAMCSDIGIEYPNKQLAFKTFATGPGERATINQLDGEDTWYYHFWHIQNNDQHLGFVYWTSTKDKGRSDNFLNKITLNQVNKNDQTTTQFDNDKLALSTNKIGLYYYNQRNYIKSLELFKQAQSLSPDTTTYITNTLDTYNNLKQYQQGLEWLLSLDTKTESNDITAWQAWYYAQLNDHPKAFAQYEKLFTSDYNNEEDACQYLLSALQTNPEIDIKRIAAKADPQAQSLSIQQTLATCLQNQSKHAEAIQVIEQIVGDQDITPELSYVLFDSLYDTEDYQRITRTCEDLVNRGYENGSLWHWKAEAQLALSQYREAKTSYEKALAYTPDDETLKENIRYVAGLLGGGDNINIKTPIEAIPLAPDLQKIIGKSTNNIQWNEEFNINYLYDIRCINFTKGEQNQTSIYSKVKVLNKAGLSEVSTLQFDFNPLYQRIFVNEVIVRNEQGEIKWQGTIDDYYVIDVNEELKSYDRRLHIPISSLSIGDTLESVVSIAYKNSNEWLNFETYWMSAWVPIFHSAIILNGDVENIAHQHQHCQIIKETNEQIIWHQANPKMYKHESLMADPDFDFAIVRLGSKNDSWAAVSRNEYERIQKILQENEPISTLAKQLVGNNTEQRAKIEQFVQYISDHMVYQGIEFGTRGVTPKSPSKTLSDKHGDCKDLSLLLCALCQSVGIDAHPTLVHSSQSIIPEIISADQFNHVIVHIPDIGFIDPTLKLFFLPEYAPLGLNNAHALPLTASGHALININDYAKSGSSIKCQRHITIKENAAIINETCTIDAYYACFLKLALNGSNQNDLEDWFDARLQNTSRGIRLESLSISGQGSITDKLVITSSYHAPAAVKAKGKHIELIIPNIWEEFYLDIGDTKERNRDYEILYALNMQTINTIDIPDSHILDQQSQVKSADEQTGINWSIHSKLDSNTNNVRLISSAQTQAGRHPKSKHKAFSQSCFRFLDNSKGHLVLSKKQSE